ncbi:MAG TPA: SufS family cysteine desulfurase [Acidimicrobiia bacterium]|nr:SufS family cysteine desulfurase [Acidimicrobiia bacterium]
MSTLDVARIKRDFPILAREVHGQTLVYLDSASSSQKPVQVLDAMERCYRESYANVHRGVYTIAEEVTAAFEASRTKVARLMHAPSTSEIVFTKNATEAINLVAHSWGRANLRAGDVVVLTEMEHHANVIPWHMLASEIGIELRWIPLTPDHRLDLGDLDRLLDGAKLLAVTAVSNVLGTINDVEGLVAAAHAAGALVLVDAAQAVPHLTVDVTAWDADFVGFTGHKMLGPSGIGGLWARAELLEAMPPFMGGGEMIRDVTTTGFTTNDVPWKFEAGTPPIVEAIGLGAAVDYLDALGLPAIRAHERALTEYALDALALRFGDRLTIYGPTDLDVRGGVLSFLFEGIHAHDVSQVVDEAGVCVRAGHHCAKPLMRSLGVPATTRASFYVYNDESDVDALVEALATAEKFFGI